MIKIYKLQNQIKHYEWGSKQILPEFLGLVKDGHSSNDKPYAEMWMGTHPSAPSQAYASPEASASVEASGSSVSLQEISGELPFLLKLIAVEKPLSIQVHPNKEQAQKGFERENKEGIELNSPQRNYKDQNAKSEIICAITPFTLMAGFKEPKEIYSSLSAVSKEQREFIKIFETLYPEDSGVFSPLYLNLITLQPGQGLFIPPGTPHAYIKGFGVELMTNSDNVLRGGLTHKHIDIEEFKKIVKPVPFFPEIITPSCKHKNCYPLPEEDFCLFYINGNETVSFPESKNAVCIVTEGELKTGGLSFKKGESFYISSVSGNEPLLLNGNFSLFAACVTK
jgi:mannose-6-phosphate isomerase